MTFTKKEAAVCGLFCPGCGIYIGTTEDPKILENIAKRFNTPAEQMKCFGCRADIRNPYCDTCKLYQCAKEKNIDFCGECSDYPCNDLKEFQAAGAHRFELWNAQDQIVKIGYKKWMENMIKYYSCPKCGTINSAYDQNCRSCGHSPSNQYVAEHGQEVWDFISKNMTPPKKE